MAGHLELKESDEHVKILNDIGKIIEGTANDASPEALFISALLETGSYIPITYGIKHEQINGHKPVHEFCLRYQADANTAPPLHLVKERYPNFPFVPDINPIWAASMLYQAHANRTLRKTMARATAAIVDENNAEAIEILKDGIANIRPAVTAGIDFTDLSIFEETTTLGKCAVPDGVLLKHTGGIVPGDLWYVAARLGVGKSWRLIQHAVAAAEDGWDVAFFSLEMPAKYVIDRIHRVALKEWDKPWSAIDKVSRRKLLEKWSKGRGAIKVYDPSHGRCDAAMLASVAEENTLVIVDYAGLMHTTSGTRAIEDWRAMATISNQLKEVALSNQVPIIAAAQVNRAGGRAEGGPSTEHLAQSDALGQDADAIITLRTFSERVLVNSITKYRHGASGLKWFTSFEPNFGKFHDITTEEAHTTKALDEERAQSNLY